MSAMRDGVALTRNQELVLDALERASGPLGAYALLDELRPQGFRAPLQVYRALDKLLEGGLVHRLDSINAFVACVHPHCHRSATTAFAICERCKAVEEFTDDVVAERLGRWCGEQRFSPARTTIEMRGVCAACAA
jgi:Fur family transcriptional regulator, zinc uptake regulator